MEVYVIRHTAVAVPKGLCYGQYDVALADTAQEDIAKVLTKLPGDFEQVYSSPSSRCSLLAEQLSTKPIAYRPDLMEMNFGDWENQQWDALDPGRLDDWMNDFVHKKAPSGESLEELSERVNTFISMLRTQEMNKVAIVTHAGVIRCIWANILEIPLHNIFKIPVNFGSGIIVQLGKDKAYDQIRSFSD
ncbi:alpha-ribazole phosphatase [Pedobacter gandavensis]|uniref:alpha-ribazole phosphatase n=1 Tax=Pedobacter gandavensis TaxID=2679963 RepID=UPI002930B93F|nr:alpha-ribazole phosphatase [Pedobacter gandavensis]